MGERIRNHEANLEDFCEDLSRVDSIGYLYDATFYVSDDHGARVARLSHETIKNDLVGLLEQYRPDQTICYERGDSNGEVWVDFDLGELELKESVDEPPSVLDMNLDNDRVVISRPEGAEQSDQERPIQSP